MSEINFFADLAINVKQALDEDIGAGDLTASLISHKAMASAKIIAKENAIVCGRPWFDAVFNIVSKDIKIDWLVQEGEKVSTNTIICKLKGPATSLLTSERSALNFLQTLSSTATLTASYIEHLKNTNTKLLDTRKTIPCLRLAQKYAVKCGGGTNHRVGLYDAILIKENHIMSAGSIEKALFIAKNKYPSIKVEVEIETIAELQQALDAKSDIIMLDNFSTKLIIEAVKINKNHSNTAKLEVSGNIEINRLSELATIGVDFISTGAITKNIQAIDYSMRFEII
jgi:nicotinate-nucleotide pyrophosphorylase (carboxylating)